MGKKIIIVLDLIMGLCVLGTLWPAMPIFGFVGGTVTIMMGHFWLPLLCLWLCAHIAWLIRTHSGYAFYSSAIVVATLSVSAVVFYQAVASVNRVGGHATVYRGENHSQVKEKTYTYTQGVDGPLKLSVYKSAAETNTKPIIILIHGGGWISGDRHYPAYYANAFANKGYVVVSLDYDLSSKSRHLSYLTEKQIQAGLAWVVTHQRTINGDAKRLNVAGDSAGGNLALDVSYKINRGDYKVFNGVTLPKIKAVSTLYPVANPRTFYNNVDVTTKYVAQHMVFSYFGKKPNRDAKLYRDRTPENFISNQAPPTLTIVGRNDTLVPVEATVKLHERLRKKDVPEALIEIPWANHGFDSFPGNFGSQAFVNISHEWFKRFDAR